VTNLAEPSKGSSGLANDAQKPSKGSPSMVSDPGRTFERFAEHGERPRPNLRKVRPTCSPPETNLLQGSAAVFIDRNEPFEGSAAVVGRRNRTF
jgi:hypothetical protein